MKRDEPSRCSPEDRSTVARLLGREPSGQFEVAVRTPEGAPIVIRNAPFMDDGTPMPTRYWLVDQKPTPSFSLCRMRLTQQKETRRSLPTTKDPGRTEVSGAPAGASSASTPTWPGTWREEMILSAAGQLISWVCYPTPTCQPTGAERVYLHVGSARVVW
jgi:hypothetical protein